MVNGCGRIIAANVRVIKVSEDAEYADRKR